jgi:hypothetical protein
VKNSENHSGTSLGTNTPGAEGRPSYGPCGRCDLPYKAHAVAHPPMSLARRMALTQCFYITPPPDERPEARCWCPCHPEGDLFCLRLDPTPAPPSGEPVPAEGSPSKWKCPYCKDVTMLLWHKGKTIHCPDCERIGRPPIEEPKTREQIEQAAVAAFVAEVRAETRERMKLSASEIAPKGQNIPWAAYVLALVFTELAKKWSDK